MSRPGICRASTTVSRMRSPASFTAGAPRAISTSRSSAPPSTMKPVGAGGWSRLARGSDPQAAGSEHCRGAKGPRAAGGPHRPLTNLRWIPLGLCHRPILSSDQASNFSGAVHTHACAPVLSAPARCDELMIPNAQSSGAMSLASQLEPVSR